MSVTQPECVYLWPYVASMQCACAIVSFITCTALQYYFPLFLINGTIFRRIVTIRKQCVLVFSTTFV